LIKPRTKKQKPRNKKTNEKSDKWKIKIKYMTWKNGSPSMRKTFGIFV